MWPISPIIALWDWNLKSGSLMLNSLHLKHSEDCNLNLITVGKLNTEVNSYVPFWQTTILNEQNVSFPLYLQRRVFYNSHLYSLYVGSLLQLCSFCFTANVLKNIMDNLTTRNLCIDRINKMGIWIHTICFPRRVGRSFIY